MNADFSPPNAGFGIYIHWPFCNRICPYCDFNVYKNKGDQGEALIEAICGDLAYWRDMSGPRNLTSIHLGGGTPSLLSADQLGRLIEEIDKLWNIPDVCEIALEANPVDANETLWRAYKAAGLNRLSLGVQSFDDRVLQALGRDHSGAQAQLCLALATKIFKNVSADLIFGHSLGHDQAGWLADLETLISHGLPHMSCYQLTIEPGTAFAKAAARGKSLIVNENKSADLYDLTRERLGQQGYVHYEVSNYAKSGSDEDFRSAHNLIYWRGGDYVGVGPGAHGRLSNNGQRLATISRKRPLDYISHVNTHGHGFMKSQPLCATEHAQEYVLMGLRILEGISLSHFQAIAGAPLDAAGVKELLDYGLLERAGADRLIATPQGRLLLDSVTQKLLGA